VPGGGPITSRRNVLLGTAGLAAAGVAGAGLAGAGLTGCGSEGEATVPGGEEALASLVPAFPRSVPHVPAGVPTRLPYLIADAEGIPLADIAGEVGFVVTKGQETILDTTVAPRAEGIPRAYLPLGVEFPAPGIYDVTATYGGQPLVSQVEVFPPEEVPSPVVGQQLPPAFTATEDNPGLVDPICTLVPRCPFHTANLEAVVRSGTRIVLLVATPAFCQTAFCGPTLGNLIDLADGRDDLLVIHSEVYLEPKSEPDLSDAMLAPVPEDYALTIEPVLYVTDAAGTITARADAVVDRSEMAELIA
jgi:hypothetical protein